MQLDGYLSALGQLPSYDEMNRFQLGNRALAMENDKSAQAQRDAVQQQGQARVRSQQMAADVAAYNTRPTSEAAVRMMTTYPEMREPVKEAWNLRTGEAQRQHLNDLTQMKFALGNGKPELAIGILQRHVDTAVQGGEDPSEDQHMIDMIRQDPTRFASNLDGLIAAVTPDKYGDTTKALADSTKALADSTKTLGDNSRAAQLQPSLVRRGNAEASQAQTGAAYAPQIAQSTLATQQAQRRDVDSQIATRAAQVDIARDTLTTNVQMKLQELEDAGAKPDAGSVGIMNSAVVSGSSNAALAEQSRNLADQFGASAARGGAFSGLAEVSKGVFGRQDAVSMLRGRYEQLRNSTAIKSLPPGPASDKDVKIAMQGFPSPTAPREYIVSWLRGMAKLQDIQASNDNARAEWIAGNGNLGTAKRDILVSGVQIPKGTSYVDYQRRSTATADRQTIPPRPYMEFAH